MRSLALVVICCMIQWTSVHCRKHHLVLKNDDRRLFKVSSFGYAIGGSLDMRVEEFSFEELSQQPTSDRFGFTLIQSMSDTLSPYIESRDGGTGRCFLTRDPSDNEDGFGLISMTMDMEKESVILTCSPRLADIRISDTSVPASRKRRAAVDLEAKNNSTLVKSEAVPLHVDPVAVHRTAGGHESGKEPESPKADAVAPAGDPHPPAVPAHAVEQKEVAIPVADNNGSDSEGEDQDPGDRRENPAGPADESPALAPEAAAKEESKPVAAGDGDEEAAATPSSTCKSLSSLRMEKTLVDGRTVWKFGFKILMMAPTQVGLYSVYFHSCPNRDSVRTREPVLLASNLSVRITEKNVESYLSAGEVPLPQLHFFLSIVFFLMGCLWLQVLRSRRHQVFKVHLLMGCLVFVKALALLLHGFNYQFVSVNGSESETWAILYYGTSVVKGTLLLLTILLIGTGWLFVKHILSDRDKQLFMLVIPMQVLANIAEIVTQESEPGSVAHNKWREIFILVDLMCCGAILFPVVWSIRHLQQAAHVDGKAADNLEKLRLFRRFYLLVVCYIYFTRIIVYLLRISLPFHAIWIHVLCQQAAILIFFTTTGVYFQPTSRNPYFRVSDLEAADLEMEEVLFEVTPNSYTENLTKKKKRRDGDLTLDVDVGDDDDADDRHVLISKRESSHDFD